MGSETMRSRVPPGQYVTDKWPVLTYGAVPRVDPTVWDLRLTGELTEAARFDAVQFRALPYSTVTADFHCVTGWSRLENTWGGVLTRDLLARVRPTPEAAFVVVSCDGGYTTNLALGDFRADNVILAYHHDGVDLPREHGGPLRLVVPHLYGWKSAKWVRTIELTRQDRPGFWEVRGYHNHGDPWLEERYS